jgi:hypothetical protein
MAMNAVKARVQNARLVLDEPTTLPEGCEVTLAVVDGDELDDDERAALHRALDERLDDSNGRLVDEDEVRAALRKLRGP